MNRFVVFGAGVLARFLSMLARFYADWQFGRLSDGLEESLDLIRDLGDFCRALVGHLASQWSGRRERQIYQEPGYERQLFDG